MSIVSYTLGSIIWNQYIHFSNNSANAMPTKKVNEILNQALFEDDVSIKFPAFIAESVTWQFIILVIALSLITEPADKNKSNLHLDFTTFKANLLNHDFILFTKSQLLPLYLSLNFKVIGYS